jgi:hypothetical protein
MLKQMSCCKNIKSNYAYGARMRELEGIERNVVALQDKVVLLG